MLQGSHHPMPASCQPVLHPSSHLSARAAHSAAQRQDCTKLVVHEYKPHFVHPGSSAHPPIYALTTLSRAPSRFDSTQASRILDPATPQSFQTRANARRCTSLIHPSVATLLLPATRWKLHGIIVIKHHDRRNPGTPSPATSPDVNLASLQSKGGYARSG